MPSRLGSAEIAQLLVSLRATSDKFGRDLDAAQSKLRRTSQTMTQIGKGLTLGVTAPLAALGVGFIKAAADAEAVNSRFKQVFKESASTAETELQKMVDAVGGSITDLKNQAALLQDTFVPLGFARDDAARLSVELVKLAQDLASFKDADPTDTITRLTSALVGNHEAVRGFGIVITEAALKAELLELGLKGGVQQATEQQKAMARLSLIMKGTADAQGDLARTQNEFNNQQRLLKGEIKELSIELGNELLPIARDLLLIVRDWVKAFRELSPETKKTILVVGGISAALGPVLLGLSQLINLATLTGGGLSKMRGHLAKASASLAGRAGFLGALGRVGAFLTGPWGIALAAASLSIVYFQDEIASAITKIISFGAHLVGIETDAAAFSQAIKQSALTTIGQIDEMEKRLGMLPESLRRTREELQNTQAQAVSGFMVGVDPVGMIRNFFGLVDKDLQKLTASAQAQIETLSRNGEAVKNLVAQYQAEQITAAELETKLAELMRTHSGVSDAANDAAGATETFDQMMERIAQQTAQQAAEALQQFRDSMLAILDPTRSLNEEVAKLSEAGFNAGQIALILGERFQEAADAEERMAAMAKYLGIELPRTQLSETAQNAKNYSDKLTGLQVAQELAAAAQEKLKKEFREGNALLETGIATTLKAGKVTREWSDETLAAVQRLNKLREETKRNVQTIGELVSIGKSAEEILLATGISASDLRDRMRTLGIELDETTEAFLRQIDAAEESARLAQQWRDAWSHAMGRVVSEFSDGITRMLFEGDKFSFSLKNIFLDLAKSIVKIMVGNLFTKLTGLFGGFLNKIKPGFGSFLGFPGGSGGNPLSGLLGGGGGGGLLGSLTGGGSGGSGGGGLLNRLLGIGGIGAAGGGAAVLAGGGTLATTSLSALPFTGLTVPLTTSLAAGGPLAAGGTAATATTAAGSGGFLSSAGAFLTNPWTIGIGAAIGLFFGLRKLLARGIGDVAKDIQRDFSIAFSTDSLKQFAKQVGISNDTLKKFTKSTSTSPAFVKFAQSVGVSNEELKKAFASVEVFGEKVNLTREITAALAGDYSLLNDWFVRTFSASDQYISALGGSLDKLLVKTSDAKDAAEDLDDSTEDAADSAENLGKNGSDAIEKLRLTIENMVDVMRAGFEDMLLRLEEIIVQLGGSVENLASNLGNVVDGLSAKLDEVSDKMSDVTQDQGFLVDLFFPGANSAGSGRTVVLQVDGREIGNVVLDEFDLRGRERLANMVKTTVRGI